MIRDAAGIDEADHAVAAIDKLRSLAGSVVAPDEVDDLVFQLGLPLNLTEHPGGIGVRPSGPVGLPHAGRGLSEASPLVLVFEDGHELRPAMLDLIERLTARGCRCPTRVAVVFMAARPELWDDRPGGGPRPATPSRCDSSRCHPRTPWSSCGRRAAARIAEPEADVHRGTHRRATRSSSSRPPACSSTRTATGTRSDVGAPTDGAGHRGRATRRAPRAPRGTWHGGSRCSHTPSTSTRSTWSPRRAATISGPWRKRRSSWSSRRHHPALALPQRHGAGRDLCEPAEA